MKFEQKSLRSICVNIIFFQNFLVFLPHLSPLCITFHAAQVNDILYQLLLPSHFAPILIMELLEHLGILPLPNPTLKSVCYRVRGTVILYVLFRLLVLYHVMSAVFSSGAIVVPHIAEPAKRACGEWFWSVALYLMVCNLSICKTLLTPEFQPSKGRHLW